MSDAERFDIDVEPRERSGWMIHWDWVLVLSIAWLLFELFAQPMLSIATASLKFGLDDFLNGWWLWRRDSDARRGRTCGIFYTAAGFWQITVMTLVLSIVGMMCVVIIQAAHGPQPMEGAREAELGAGISILIVSMCFVASSIATWLAMLLAWRYRQRIWLDGTVRYSRRQSIWPPRPVGTNRISRVVTSSLIFLVVSSTVASLLIVMAAAGRQPNLPGWAAGTPVICLCVSVIASLVVGNWAIRSVSAQSAEDCWTDEVEVVGESDVFVFDPV